MFDMIGFTGLVEDREDPLKLGRCKIRITGLHPDDQTLVPTDDLPWASPIQQIQSAAAFGIGWTPVGPVVGTRVLGFFLDGKDCQIPIFYGTLAGQTGHLSFPAVTDSSAVTEPSPTNKTEEPSATELAPLSGSVKVLGPVPSDYNSKSGIVARKLMDRYGLKDYQAAAIVGNLGQESGMSPNIRNGGTHGEPVEGKAYGWAQWYDRRNEFVVYAKEHNLDVQSDEANYQFMCHEFDTVEKNSIKRLKETTSLEEATVSFRKNYERPAEFEANDNRRIQKAADAFKSLTGVGVPVRTTGTNEDATVPAPDDVASSTVGNEPPSPFRGQYPYVKSFRSESGHVIEIDDTPGRERLFDYHKTGTYQEIVEDGRRVVKVVGDNYTVVAQDDSLYVDGAVKIFVKGNTSLKCEGDVIMNVDGNINALAQKEFKLKAAAVSIESTSGPIDINSASELNATSGSTWNLLSGAAVNIDADGSLVIQQGAAKTARKTGLGVSLNADELSFLIDDVDSEMVDAYQSAAVESGQISAEDLAKDPTESEKDTSKPKDVKPMNVKCDGFDGLDSYPDSLKLTPNYTLGSVTKYTAASSHGLTAQRGLEIGEIACNLRLVALNCLEPIKSQYPNMIVTSGFRAVNDGKSQHEIGQAMDMQFRGASNKDYFAIAQWIRDNVAYDQLLLEGKSTGTGNAWIHVSFNKNGNRRQVLSLWNNKTRGQGLIQMY